jgi:hypothetical protein
MPRRSAGPAFDAPPRPGRRDYRFFAVAIARAYRTAMTIFANFTMLFRQPVIK